MCLMQTVACTCKTMQHMLQMTVLHSSPIKKRFTQHLFNTIPTLFKQLLSSHIYMNKSPVIINISVHIQSLQRKLQKYNTCAKTKKNCQARLTIAKAMESRKAFISSDSSGTTSASGWSSYASWGTKFSSLSHRAKCLSWIPLVLMKLCTAQQATMIWLWLWVA